MTDSLIRDHLSIDLVSFESVESVKIPRLETVEKLKEVLSERYEIPNDQQRIWLFESSRESYRLTLRFPPLGDSDRSCDFSDRPSLPTDGFCEL